MKTLVAAFFVIMGAVSGHSEDMQAYLRDTQALVREGKHEEALERFQWFHEHALEHDPSMYGVRLSFALSYWHQLGQAYPPALTALKQTRDTKTAVVKNGKGTFALFHDVSALNRTLREEGQTVALFRELDESQKSLAQQCWQTASDAVINEKAYDLAKKYLTDPVAEFGKVKAQFDRNLAMYDRFGASFKKFNETNLVKQSVQLIEVATAIGNAEAARNIQAQALAIVDDERLRRALAPAN